VQYPLQIPQVGSMKRCTYCKSHHDNNLRCTLSRLLKQQQQEGQQFLTEKLSQDPLEKLFGCQWQMCRTNDNPKVHEFICNTQSLRVIDSINVNEITGNCRETKWKAYDL